MKSSRPGHSGAGDVPGAADELAARAREEHARLVVERAGDPRYVQRRLTADGRRQVTWDPDSPAGGELSRLLHAQLDAFRGKFGRDPEPGDPLFFDPDADEPLPLPTAAQQTMWGRLERVMAAAGIDPVYALGAADVGYLVVEHNRHLFTALQVQAYSDAVERHQAPELTGEEGLDWDGTGSPPALTSVRPGDLRVAHTAVAVACWLRDLVAQVVTAGTATRVRDAVDDQYEAAQADDDPAALGLVIEAVFLVLESWVNGARDVHVLEPAAGWAARTLDGDAARRVRRLVDHLGRTSAGPVDIQAVTDLLDRDTVPTLIYLAAGAVATAGQHNVAWLESFDPTSAD